MSKKIGVIGGGPSGLSISLFLGSEAEVLEATSQVGGVGGTFFDSGFTFDYGPHIMFSKNQAVLDFMVGILEDNVHTCKRNNKVSFESKLIKYPFENDLSKLSPEAKYDCAHGYFFNPFKEKYKNPENLKEWLLHHFGEGICHHYLFPYNEKVWNIPVDNLSMLWADRIPKPPAEDILKSLIGIETEGYLHQLFYKYPLVGGYKAISDALANKLDVIFDYRVNFIEKTSSGSFVLHSDDGRTKEFESVVSTMPIHLLVNKTNLEIPIEIRAAVDALIVNPMAIVSLGLKGVDKEKYTAVYFPEKEFLVNRISYPGTFSPQNCPDSTYSIQAEITYATNSETSKLTDEEMIAHVVSGLDRRGIVSKENVIFSRVDRLDYAYVVYDKHYQENVKKVRDWFWSNGIYLNGRFGHFEYLNVDGIIDLSKNIAQKITGKTYEYKDFY
jgi:protoporphyrinogen oxidase